MEEGPLPCAEIILVGANHNEMKEAVAAAIQAENASVTNAFAEEASRRYWPIIVDEFGFGDMTTAATQGFDIMIDNTMLLHANLPDPKSMYTNRAERRRYGRRDRNAKKPHYDKFR